MDNSLNISDIVSATTAFLAVVISLLSYFNSRRKTTIDSITTNRMEWIKEVRNYCASFLFEFNKSTPDLNVLRDLSMKIQLHGYGDTYTELFDSLNECIQLAEKGNTDVYAKDFASQQLLQSSQEVLNGVWWRMKREAGISAMKDKIINKAYNKRYKKRKTKK